MFKKFQEYMDARGKINQPQEKQIADYDGPNPKSPPPSKAPTALDKEMAPPKTKHEPQPYSAPGQPAGNKAGESGFGDTGDKNLIYEPDTKKVPKQDNIEGLNRKNYPPNKKTKTEHFLDATKGMSIHEFTNYMIAKRKEGLDDLPVISDSQHPEEIIRYVSVLASKSDSIMEDLIHALKRNGCFKKLIESLMDIPESLNMITELFSDDTDGARRCRQLVRCMEDLYTESVGPPFGIKDDEGGTNGQPFDTVPGEDEEDEEGAGPSPEDEFDPDDDEDEGDEGDEYDDDDDDDDNEDEEGEESEFDDDENGFPKKKKKKKKRFAHDNLLDAMGEYEHMRAKMRGY